MEVIYDLAERYDLTKYNITYKLFNKYNFTEDEIKHIYDILPNYYNIKRIDLNIYKNIKVEN